MWEVSENLHRAELTVLQRSEQVARWVELADGVSAQLGQKSSKGRPEGRPEGGDAKAARELNLDRKEVQRAKKIADLSPEAKAAAQEAGLADIQSALLAAAKVPLSQQARSKRGAAPLILQVRRTFPLFPSKRAAANGGGPWASYNDPVRNGSSPGT